MIGISEFEQAQTMKRSVDRGSATLKPEEQWQGILTLFSKSFDRVESMAPEPPPSKNDAGASFCAEELVFNFFPIVLTYYAIRLARLNCNYCTGHKALQRGLVVIIYFFKHFSVLGNRIVLYHVITSPTPMMSQHIVAKGGDRS